MNMIMHDVHYKRFDIKNEDTLERPLHLDLRFVPLWLILLFANWSASPLFMNDDRFSGYGKLAPKLILPLCNTVHQLDDNVDYGIVLPHGACFAVPKVTYQH
jgi:type I restriction enzyme M protein